MWCSITIQPQPVLVCKKDDKEAFRVALKPSCALPMADDLHPGATLLSFCFPDLIHYHSRFVISNLCVALCFLGFVFISMQGVLW